MSANVQEAARRGVNGILESLGIHGVSAAEVELIAGAVSGLVETLGGGALKRAAAARKAAEDAITDSDAAEKSARERT